jgi:hypothetical protein
MAHLSAVFPLHRNVARRFGDLITESVEAVKTILPARPIRRKRQHYPELRPAFVETAAMRREMYRL